MSEGTRFAPEKSIKNWSDYNNGLVNRYNITFWLSDDSIFQTPAATGKRGRPQKYSNGLIELCLTVKSLFHLPYRGLEGFLRGLFNYSAQNKPVPDYSTFCVRAADLDVKVKTSLKSHEPLHVLVDSTGLKIYGEGEWKVRTHGASKRRTWRKLHLVMDAKTQQIIGMSLTKNDIGDQEHLPELLAKIPSDLSILSVTGDGIYDSYTCYDEVKKHNAVLITPPRKNAVVYEETTPKGGHPRANVIKKCNELGRTEWKKEVGYHKRSRVESGMYRYKSSCGDKMFSRGFERQESEAKVKVNVLNKFRDMAAPVYA